MKKQITTSNASNGNISFTPHSKIPPMNILSYRPGVIFKQMTKRFFSTFVI